MPKPDFRRSWPLIEGNALSQLDGVFPTISRMSEINAQKNQAPNFTADDAREFAIAVARLAAEMKTTEVQVLDLHGLSSLADFFVIGTGTSDRQMHAVLGKVEERARQMRRRPFKVSDSTSASWILADYVDVVVHLFDSEHRDYYDLDGLWGDAPRVSWEPEESARSAD